MQSPDYCHIQFMEMVANENSEKHNFLVKVKSNMSMEQIMKKLIKRNVISEAYAITHGLKVLNGSEKVHELIDEMNHESGNPIVYYQVFNDTNHVLTGKRKYDQITIGGDDSMPFTQVDEPLTQVVDEITQLDEPPLTQVVNELTQLDEPPLTQVVDELTQLDEPPLTQVVDELIQLDEPLTQVVDELTQLDEPPLTQVVDDVVELKE